jgi:hypothetical protein
MPNTKMRVVSVLFIAVAIAGCGSDGSTAPKGGPTSSNPLDLAPIFAQMSIGDVNAIPGTSSVLPLPASAALPVIVPSACTYSSSAGGFTCPTTTFGGLTFTFSYFLYDAAGHPQSAADATTTASVRTVIDGTGTLTISSNTVSGTVAIKDHQDMTLSGLLTPTRILNGTGATHFDVTLTGPAPLHAVTDETSTTSNVTLKAPGTSGPNWPTAGTITTDVTTTTGTGSPITFKVHTVVTFNGTGLVTIVSTVNGGVVETCTIDLSGQTAPSCKTGA